MKKKFNVRLPLETIKLLKLHCLENDEKIESIIDLAILTFLQRYEMITNLGNYGTTYDPATFAFRRASRGEITS